MRWMMSFVGVVSAVLLMTAPGAAVAQERVVTIGGDVTEIVFALGAADRIVATDTTSEYPPAAKDTPKVGYVRQLSAEGVLSVQPDLVLISGAAGPKTALDQLEASGVEVVQMQTRYTIPAIYDKVRRVASALNLQAEGEALVERIKADWQAAQEEVAKIEGAPDMLFFATLNDGAPRAAGDRTAASGLIQALGGENVFAGRPGYKTLSLEAALEANPDVILVMERYQDRPNTVDGVADHPALRLTEAARTRSIVLVDPVMSLQFGPRTPQAVEEIARKLQSTLDGNGS